MIIKNKKTIRFTENEFKVIPKLENKNYLVKFDDLTGEFYLEEQDDFTLPEKLYGNLGQQVKRYLNTFKNRNKNLGILLKGLKGTGKSLVAKKLCIDSNLPVLLITTAYKGTAFQTFLSNIKQECIVFIDEFEKVFKSDDYSGDQDSLLTILDGVFEGKKIFLLTANNKRKISDALINRPGRILYLKEYNGLSKDVINEVAEDYLKNKKDIPELLEICNIIGDVNMDSLISLIEECNMYEENPRQAINNLNIRPANCNYELSWKKVKNVYVGDKEPLLEGESMYKNKELIFKAIIHTHPLATQKIDLYGNSEEGESDRIRKNISDFKIDINEDIIILKSKDQEIKCIKKPMYSYIF